jgi:hypothetical protein
MISPPGEGEEIRKFTASEGYFAEFSKCGAGVLACEWMHGGQPQAVILHDTFPEVSSWDEKS